LKNKLKETFIPEQEEKNIIDNDKWEQYRYTEQSNDNAERFNIQQRHLDQLKGFSVGEKVHDRDALFLTLNFDVNPSIINDDSRNNLSRRRNIVKSFSNVSNSRLFKRSEKLDLEKKFYSDEKNNENFSKIKNSNIISDLYDEAEVSINMGKQHMETPTPEEICNKNNQNIESEVGSHHLDNIQSEKSRDDLTINDKKQFENSYM
jgi:hypothetical protein